MVVLETSIQFRGRMLVEKQYPANKGGKFIQNDFRDLMFSSLSDFATQVFDEDLKGVTMGNYHIFRISRTLHSINTLNNEMKENNKESKIKNKDPLFEEENDEIISIYTIADKKTNHKVILECMNTALEQFLNRYSLFDIRNFKIEHFKSFEERLMSIFGDLVYTTEDRLRSIF
ncbi:hypothetical protein [Candidatus Harpocratesius sp.]